jgi:hypothetical protein
MPAPRNPALDLIAEEFPAIHQRFVGPALRRAYSAVTAAIEAIDFLDNPSGRLQRGDLIVKSAEFEFSKLIAAGNLPGVEPSLEDYALPTGKHLVMRTARAFITISQVPTINTRPRAAVCRENFGMANTECLFEEMNIEARREGSRKHLLVIHGYHDLTHAAVAMPHPTAYRLIARTDNLLDLDAGDFGTHSPPEGPTDSPDLEAIENVVRIVRDTK